MTSRFSILFILGTVAAGCADDSVPAYDKFTSENSYYATPEGKVVSTSGLRITFPPNAVKDVIEVSANTFDSHQVFVTPEKRVVYVNKGIALGPSIQFQKEVKVEFDKGSFIFKRSTPGDDFAPSDWALVGSNTDGEGVSTDELTFGEYMIADRGTDNSYFEKDLFLTQVGEADYSTRAYSNDTFEKVIAIERAGVNVDLYILFPEEPKAKVYGVANASENGLTNSEADKVDVVAVSLCTNNGCADERFSIHGSVEYFPESGKLLIQDLLLKSTGDLTNSYWLDHVWITGWITIK